MAKKLVFVPFADRVLVKPDPAQTQTEFGILIPELAQERPQMGTVAAVGIGEIRPDGEVIPLEVEVGDRVMFTKYGATEVMLNGEPYLIFREKDMLGMIFEEDEAAVAAQA